jgi:hypothetical protein
MYEQNGGNPPVALARRSPETSLKQNQTIKKNSYTMYFQLLSIIIINVSGIDDVLAGLTRPRREVVVSPFATLEYFEITEKSMQRLLLSLKL